MSPFAESHVRGRDGSGQGRTALRRPQSHVARRSAPRPLRRTIQRLVEDPLSEKLLWKEFKAGQTITVDNRDDEVVFESVPVPRTLRLWSSQSRSHRAHRRR